VIPVRFNWGSGSISDQRPRTVPQLDRQRAIVPIPARDIDFALIDMWALQMWLAVLIGWLDRQGREALAYLIEERNVLIAGAPALATCAVRLERA